MQLLARLMDHALEARGERRTIVVATSGDTGGAAVEAFRDRNQVDRRRPVSARPVSPRAAAHDDDGERRQHPRDRHRGHLRRLPGDREGMFDHAAFRDRVAALRRQFDQLGAHRRADGVLLHRRGGARRAAPQDRVHGADRQFRRRLRRLCGARAWGCRSTGSPSRPTSTTFWRARSRAALTKCATVVPTTSPSMDIQVSSNFERLLFDANGRDAGAVRAADGVAGAVAALHAVGARARRRSARCSAPTAPTRRKTAATMRTMRRETGNLIDPHTAVGIAVAEKETARSGGADGGAVDRPSGEISRSGRGGERRPPALCPTGFRISINGRSA